MSPTIIHWSPAVSCLNGNFDRNIFPFKLNLLETVTMFGSKCLQNIKYILEDSQSDWAYAALFGRN